MTAHKTSKVPRCDICGTETARELYNAKDRLSNSSDEYTIAECTTCGVWRTLPIVNDSQLSKYYGEDYWGASQEPSQKWIESSQTDKTAFLRRCGLTRGRILDVGCGSGFFLRALSAENWDRFGVEISSSASETAAHAIGANRVFAGTLSDVKFEPLSFDVITFWSSLEHTNKPRSNLAAAHRLMKPGGALIVQLPNRDSYQAEWFGRDWFALDAPRHRYHFNLTILDGLLRETGFELFRGSFSSKAHNAHSLKQSLKAKLLNQSSPAGRLIFYLAVPFIRPFDGLMSIAGRGATLTLAARAV